MNGPDFITERYRRIAAAMPFLAPSAAAGYDAAHHCVGRFPYPHLSRAAALEVLECP